MKPAPGSMAARRKAGLTPLQQIQWGNHSDVDQRYQLTQAEKDALKKTGYYSSGAYRIPQTRG